MNKLVYLFLSVVMAVVTACEADKAFYNTAAKADFTIGADMYDLGQMAIFADVSAPSVSNAIASRLWEFGDKEKSTSTQQNPSFLYKVDGTFTVTLTVTDNNGLTASTKKDVTILDPSKSINVLWMKNMGGAIQSTVSPALSKDGKTVYMITDQSVAGAFDVKLFAFDVATGNQRWTFDVTAHMNELNPGGGASQVFTSPSIGSNGDVYIVVRDLKPAVAGGHQRALFLFAVGSDGSRKWAYQRSDANIYTVTPAVDADGNIYWGHRGKSLVVLSSTGSVVKELVLPVEVISGVSLSKEGTIYFGSTAANGFFGYDFATGGRRFAYNDGLGSSALKGNSYTVGGDGTIYTVVELTSGGALVALSPNGTQKWSYPTLGAILNGGVVIGEDGTLYANGGKAIAANVSAGVVALKPDGTLKWHYPTVEDVSSCVPIVDNRGYVHFISDTGIYYIVKSDGTLLSSAQLGVKCLSTPVMDASGNLYAGVEVAPGISQMMCITSRAGSYANSAWPMKGQNPQRTGLQKTE